MCPRGGQLFPQPYDTQPQGNPTNQKASLQGVRLGEDTHLGYCQTSEVQLATATNTIFCVILLQCCNRHQPLKEIFIFEPENKFGNNVDLTTYKYTTLRLQRQNLQLKLRETKLVTVGVKFAPKMF